MKHPGLNQSRRSRSYMMESTGVTRRESAHLVSQFRKYNGGHPRQVSSHHHDPIHSSSRVVHFIGQRSPETQAYAADEIDVVFQETPLTCCRLSSTVILPLINCRAKICHLPSTFLDCGSRGPERGGGMGMAPFSNVTVIA